MSQKQCDVVLVSVENGCLPSLAMPSLEAYLGSNKISAEILYPRITGDKFSPFIKKIVDLKPKIVGLGGLFNDRFIIKNIIEALKPYRKDFTIVVGGNLVTPIPEFMLNKLSADIAVIGEGEIIFTNLVKRILDNKDFYDIGGLVCKNGDQMVSTGQGEYVEDLNSLPGLNYEKMPMEHFINVYRIYKSKQRSDVFNPSTRLGTVLTGRGCSYHCNFCYNFNKLRLFKIPIIISQIKELKERFKINMVTFADDLTLLSKKRTLELCQALIDGKLNLKYLASAHFNCFDEEMVRALKESGCVGVSLGLESGSQKILDRIDKKVKVEQIKNSLSLLRRYRIKWSGSIQIGQPGETESDVKKSRDLFCPYIDELSAVGVGITTPFPGTALYHYGLKEGIIKSNEDLFNKIGLLNKLVANFTQMPNWRVRYLRLRLASEFDIKKQKKLQGKWGVGLFLVKEVVRKLTEKIADIYRHRKRKL